jgi:flavin-binding protein dodecin
MSDSIYGMSEIIGSSASSIDDAIRGAVRKASEDRRHIRWFEVKEIRGHVEGGEVVHFQVELKIGYTLES